MNRYRNLLSKQSIVTIAQIYLAIVICWQIAIRTELREFWPLRLIDTFGAWLYLPIALFLPCLCFCQIRKQLIPIVLIPFLLFGWEYREYLTPKSDRSSPTDLKVMTWNVRYDNPDPQAIARVIKSEHPDLVTIQELISSTASALSNELQAEFPYRYINPITFEFGTFSKYPIQSKLELSLPFQEFQITIDATQVSLFNVHLPTPAIEFTKLGFLSIPIEYNTTKQDLIYPFLIDRLRELQQPAIVMGDFNTGDRDRNYHLFAQYLTNAFTKAGWGFGFTFPTQLVLPFPLVRIDHVFYSQHWQVKAAYTRSGIGSDHQYLVAKLARRNFASAG